MSLQLNGGQTWKTPTLLLLSLLLLVVLVVVFYEVVWCRYQWLKAPLKKWASHFCPLSCSDHEATFYWNWSTAGPWLSESILQCRVDFHVLRGHMFDLGGAVRCFISETVTLCSALLFSALLSPQSPQTTMKADQRICFHTSLVSLQSKPHHTVHASVPLTLLQFATSQSHTSSVPGTYKRTRERMKRKVARKYISIAL